MAKTAHDSETRADGQQVIVACGLIHHNFNGVEKVFLPRRAETKKFMPGVYELPGGHVDFGETTADGLKREIKEELGKDVKIGDVFAAFTYINEIKASHSIEVVYFVQFEGGIENIELDPEDHSGYEWFEEDRLEEMLVGGKTEADQEYQLIKKAFGLLKGDSLRF